MNMINTPSLTSEEIKFYLTNGVVRSSQYPFDEVKFLNLKRLTLSTIEKEFSFDQSGTVFKLFTKQPDFLDFATDNLLLNFVESLIGPDICLMGSCLFLKRAKSPKYASWHSDVGQQFEIFENMHVVSVTIAVTPSTIDSGCVRYLPQSHKKYFRRYTTENYENSLFGSRAFLLEKGEVDLSQGIINIELDPGQCSFNHFNVVHSSEPNRSAEDRILVNFKYMAPVLENGTPTGHELFRKEFQNRILVRGSDKGRLCNL